MTLNEWLLATEKKIKFAGIPSARLDAELLACHVLKVDKTWLIAHSDLEISNSHLAKLNKNLDRRAKHEPLAYIRGFVEFYGRDFLVDRYVLIPRPESEQIIDLAGLIISPEVADNSFKVLDVGAGSGCLGLTLKAENPQISITLSDISDSALKIARKNAKKLNIKPIRFVKSDLLNYWLDRKKPQKFDLIVANLPYVTPDYKISPEAEKEPQIALFAKNNGYDLIEKLVPQAAKMLKKSGFLILESDPWQQEKIANTAAKYGFKLQKSTRFHLVLQL